MRILVVEDQPALRKILRAAVESCGYQADETTNRHDGLAMLLGDPDIGIVVLDLDLEQGTTDFPEGFAFLAAISDHNPLVKVITTSAANLSDIAQKAIELNAFDFLPKPVDISQMRYALDRASLYYETHRRLREESKVPIQVVADASRQTAVREVQFNATRQLLQTILTETNHNVSQAARRLNMTREHLYYYLKRHGIQRPTS